MGANDEQHKLREKMVFCIYMHFILHLQVKVNGVEYQPSVGSTTKKIAKSNSAAVCLQNLGLIPRDVMLS